MDGADTSPRDQEYALGEMDPGKADGYDSGEFDHESEKLAADCLTDGM